MPRCDVVRSTRIVRTPRVAQVEGLFDIAPAERSELAWHVDLALPDDWHVGLVVGPSGSGKTTLARALWPNAIVGPFDWPAQKSLLDGFPARMSIKDVVALLCSVGFSSTPSWLRPYRVLSTGEQFRVHLARVLAEHPDLAVVDEFTSVVDRTVARVGSAAIAKTVRRRGQRLIAVSCHYDIAEWLEPDWIYEPATNRLSRRRLRRPPIDLRVRRVDKDAWTLFRHHHYLNTSLHPVSQCFVAFWNDAPVAFSAIVHFCHGSRVPIKREHRTVCLPDYQGIGIGNALSAWCGSLVRGLGCRYLSQTSHPGMMHSRARSPLWRMLYPPRNTRASMPRGGNMARENSGKRGPFNGRLVASFEYIGPAMAADQARALWKAC